MSEGIVEDAKLEGFFSLIGLPMLTEAQRGLLEGDISLEEVRQVISSLKMEKALGIDGFTADFYKRFQEELAPRLLVVYQDAFQRGKHPESMRSAVITILHKKGKYPQQCGNYRPISLINVDEKILAKILATRLEK